ncbi:T9SS type A sorting domain-containing protein [Niastella caeni]|uniref:T9SS type A sorting domain-containing protein n=1 Tax=Niastella caeni TaxID=2569763 RepID=A0A4S8I016_9BACT|nr:choice-of-anchor E domain-containing protein [Niastella caeni]THU41413.1 T9SS type A sorting domain-containing protein [Niastella caeni]
MKKLRRTVLLPVILFLTHNSQAQCANQLTTLSYDTTVNALGNSLYNFTFPQFNPTLGTLTEVKINSKVTLVYNFSLENGELNPVNNYRVKVFRDDEISSTSLLSPLTNSYQRQYGFYALAGSDGIPDSGPDFTQQGPLYVMNQQNINYTLSNTADFFGSGTVMFDYTTSTYSAAQGSINNNLFGSAQDAVNFIITYTYCPQIVLAADIRSFTANKLNDATIDIKWITQNEKNNQSYELQKSTDGKSFGSIAQFAAKASSTQTGSYSYSYTVQPTDNSKTLLFRIKQIEADGSARYSAVHAVRVTSKTNEQPKIYPNPAKTATNLIFSNTKRNNWQVSVYSVNGLLLKRYYFNNALTGKINTANDLEKGVYMVRSVNKTTQEEFVQQLIVQ